MEVFHRLNPRRLQVWGQAFQEHENRVDIGTKFWVLRTDHDAFTSSKEGTAELSQPGVANKRSAGGEQDQCVGFENIADVAAGVAECLLFPAQVCGAIGLGDIGLWVAVGLFIMPAGRNDEAKRPEYSGILPDQLDPFERRG